MAKEEKEHPIVAQYKTAYDISEEYTSRLSAEILKKGFVGRKANKGTIDDVVKFLHSKDVAAMIKKALGGRVNDVSDEEILTRYGLPKHVIQEELSQYESITPDAILSLVQRLSARIHGEMVSHHPAAIANLAYDKGMDAAKAVVADLLKTSGGDKYAAANQKTLDNIVTPDKLMDHTTDLYQRHLPAEMARHSDRLRKAVYQSK